MPAMRGGVGLSVLCAIALAVQPELVVLHQQPKVVQILDRLCRAEILENLEHAHLGHTRIGEGARGVLQCGFLRGSHRAAVGLIKSRGRLGAGQAAGGRYAALIEEDNVEALADAGVEGRGVRILGRQARGARPAGGSDEHALAVAGGRQHGEDHIERARVAGIEVVERDL
jgi:hypothetical protein